MQRPVTLGIAVMGIQVCAILVGIILASFSGASHRRAPAPPLADKQQPSKSMSNHHAQFAPMRLPRDVGDQSLGRARRRLRNRHDYFAPTARDHAAPIMVALTQKQLQRNSRLWSRMQSVDCSVHAAVCLDPKNSLPGRTCCGARCVDTLSDESNCGGCGHTCEWSRTCCRGRCENLQSDHNNCGVCGHGCAEGKCQFGLCGSY